MPQVIDPPTSASVEPTDETDPHVAPAMLAAFGDRVDLARRYATHLATDGVRRGLIGPREVSRLWSRHLLDCAAVAPLLPPGARVVDVGSGAGLPGIVLAIARPDLRVLIVEPMLRRTTFLAEAVTGLGLERTTEVLRGRADDREIRQAVGRVDWVTARAVAPLDRLVTWCLPLLQVGGTLLAMKGASAADEASEHARQVRAAGGSDPEVQTMPTGIEGQVARIVRVQRVRRN